MPACPFCRSQFSSGGLLTSHINKIHPHEEAMEKPTIKAQRKVSKSNTQKVIVVDGNNVAFSQGSPPEARWIKLARLQLKKNGWNPIIIVSAALRHKVKDVNDLIRMINMGWIIESEPKTDDDRLIIDTAISKKCRIITNDGFKDHLEVYDNSKFNISRILARFQFVAGKFLVIL